MDDDSLSDSDVDRIEDNLDAMQYNATRGKRDGRSRPNATFADWKLKRARSARTGGIGTIVIVAVMIALFVSNSSSGASRPSCSAHTSGCLQTADAIWVPIWYYSALRLAQGTPTGQPPLASGAQPTTEQLEESGASSDAVNEAEDYENSASDDDSSDSSGDDSSGDDSGGDDSGGGDDGGD